MGAKLHSTDLLWRLEIFHKLFQSGLSVCGVWGWYVVIYYHEKTVKDELKKKNGLINSKS